MQAILHSFHSPKSLELKEGCHGVKADRSECNLGKLGMVDRFEYNPRILKRMKLKSPNLAGAGTARLD